MASFCSLARANQADEITITVTGQAAGPSPFISKLTLDVSDLSVLERIRFSVTPKPGSVTRPISATYSRNYLAGRGYVDSQMGQITIPVFGLYDGYNNGVTLTYLFADGSSKQDSIMVATQPFNDACQFNTPTVLQARTTSTALSYDFILVTSQCAPYSPTIIDTDGAVRWVGTAGVSKSTAAFFDNAIYLPQGPRLLRIELDGTVSVLADYGSLGVINFHHNIDPGKYGLILDVNTESWVESVNLEVDGAGKVIKKWEHGEIIRAAMIAGGDDPTGFVRNAKGNYAFDSPEDWFHNNSVTYRKADDSLIISSRENFVICIDYETSAIKWIMGNRNKKWYQYPSLRKYALAVTPVGFAPIGQHSVSIARDGNLLLMDNGQQSHHQFPPGDNRSYSAARKYELDLEAKVATQVWDFSNDQSVRAPYCSSVYEDAPNNYVVDYANVRGFARILGLTPAGEKVFEYAYPTVACTDGYRSLPIHWENLAFPPPSDARLANISGRSLIATNDSVGIAGFIISGPVAKKVVLRGRGPSLQVDGQPLPGRLMNPRLELHNSNNQTLQSNDDYKNGPDAAEITQVGLAPSDDNEAAILAELPPGGYTAVVRGANDTTGIGLAEVFDVEPASPSQLGNLSSRAFTSTGDNVLIGGLILRGTKPKRVLFRALGPELEERGVENALPDTILDLYGGNGMKIRSNDDWEQAPNASEIAATDLEPTDQRESAILLPVSSGNYTLIVKGKNNAEGVALLEAFQLD
ncbi:MAG: aryl-sulfate sulfotransferase [Chthoniobacterales bacterium]